MDFLLLSLGFIGVVIVLFSNNYYIGGSISIASFIGYFLLQPQPSWLSALILFAGMVMIAFEIIIPGFGVMGVVGGLFLFWGIFLSNGDWLDALTDITISVLLVTSLVIVLIRKGYRIKLGEKLILENSLNEERGYSSAPNYSSLEGKIGQAKTILRPVGRITIDQSEYDAVSTGDVILAGKAIIVIKVEGSKIVVREY